MATLDRLFRRKPIASLEELRVALRTDSRTTVFRVVSRVGYQTSYSHAGRYYTLERIPKFDARGLWFYRGVGFSSHGTLRATVVVLVDRSAAGCTHEELQAALRLRLHDTLRSLVEDHLIGRERVEDVYVYVSARRPVAAGQLAQRRSAQVKAPAAAPLVDPARTIDVLLAVIHHPGDAPKAVVARLGAQGRLVSLEQVEQLFRRYDLPEKKTARSRSRRSRR
ncbi:MAG: hypothetical protein ACREQL_11205 [Candidatus Binatia bacterium]